MLHLTVIDALTEHVTSDALADEAIHKTCVEVIASTDSAHYLTLYGRYFIAAALTVSRKDVYRLRTASIYKRVAPRHYVLLVHLTCVTLGEHHLEVLIAAAHNVGISEIVKDIRQQFIYFITMRWTEIYIIIDNSA